MESCEEFAFSPQQDPTLENNKINWFLSATSGGFGLFLLPGQAITLVGASGSALVGRR